MDIAASFADRLNEFMILNNLNAPALAEKIGANRMTIAKLKRGRSHPSTAVFFKLIEYFHCSADYLLGLTEDYPENYPYKPPIEKFGARFRSLLEEFHISQYRLTKFAGISGNLLYKWLNDQTMPSVSNFVKLANYMETTVDHLIGRTD